jgi:hypothetical protein
MTDLLDPDTLQPIEPVDIEAKFQAIKDSPAEEVPAPRRMSPERKEELRTAPKRSRRTTAKTDKPRTDKTPPRASTPAVDKERAESVADTMNLAAGLLLMGHASNKDKNPALATALAADAATLSSTAETFGAACSNLAKHSPGFARMIDGGGKAGPWFAFTTVTFSIGSQLAVNHGMIPAGLLGTVDPAELVVMVENNEQSQEN